MISPARAELTFLREIQCKLRFLEIAFPTERNIALMRRAVIGRMMMLAQAAAFVALILVAPTAAVAQEHKHQNETIYGATGRFYETWMRPDQPLSSCCNRHDCDVAVDVKVIDGKLWARKRNGGPLISIPAEKIERGRDSPDGQSHLCAAGSTPLCFIAGTGG